VSSSRLGYLTKHALTVGCIFRAGWVGFAVTDACSTRLADDRRLDELAGCIRKWDNVIFTLTAMIYAIVAKVVAPARISVRKAVFLISFSYIKVSEGALHPKSEATDMTTALQPKDSTKGRLCDCVVDKCGILTKERHFEELHPQI
jgi:hypothetical protein